MRGRPAERDAAAFRRAVASDTLRFLPVRWRQVVLWRLEGLTLAEIGSRLGGGSSPLTRERVRQIEGQAARRLREITQPDSPEEFYKHERFGPQ